MNPAIFSPCEAANICNSPSFSIHVSLATSAVLKPVIVFARKMQLSYNTELLLPNMGIFRKCFKAVMGMAVGPNHHLMAVFPHGQGLRLYLFLTKAVLYSFIILGTLNQ